MEKPKKTVAISEGLYKNLNQLADDSGFENLEEFIDFILEEVVRNQDEKELTNLEKEEIDKGLKELGYKS